MRSSFHLTAVVMWSFSATALSVLESPASTSEPGGASPGLPVLNITTLHPATEDASSGSSITGTNSGQPSTVATVSTSPDVEPFAVSLLTPTPISAQFSTDAMAKLPQTTRPNTDEASIDASVTSQSTVTASAAAARETESPPELFGTGWSRGSRDGHQTQPMLPKTAPATSLDEMHPTHPVNTNQESTATEEQHVQGTSTIPGLIVSGGTQQTGSASSEQRISSVSPDSSENKENMTMTTAQAPVATTSGDITSSRSPTSSASPTSLPVTSLRPEPRENLAIETDDTSVQTVSPSDTSPSTEADFPASAASCDLELPEGSRQWRPASDVPVILPLTIPGTCTPAEQCSVSTVLNQRLQVQSTDRVLVRLRVSPSNATTGASLALRPGRPGRSGCTTEAGDQAAVVVTTGQERQLPLPKSGQHHFFGRISLDSEECFRLVVTVRPADCGSASLPCGGHGYCVASDTQAIYGCRCCSGRSGQLCQTSDPCSSSPCPAPAVCEPSQQSYNCRCPEGYRGGVCNATVSACASSPCLNGGTCTERGGSFFCSCITGHDGERCQDVTLPLCAVQPCDNGGTCWDEGASSYCTCPQGFSGRRCQEPAGLVGHFDIRRVRSGGPVLLTLLAALLTLGTLAGYCYCRSFGVRHSLSRCWRPLAKLTSLPSFCKRKPYKKFSEDQRRNLLEMGYSQSLQPTLEPVFGDLEHADIAEAPLISRHTGAPAT